MKWMNGLKVLRNGALNDLNIVAACVRGVCKPVGGGDVVGMLNAPMAGFH